MGESIVSAVVGSAASTVLSSIFSGGGNAPTPPTPPAPTAMPTPNSQDVQAAQAKSIATQIARRGRASTILSPQNDPGSKLGA